MNATVTALLRDDLRDFGGYKSARSEDLRGDAWLNANESAWANPSDPDARLRRYPDPQPRALRSRLAALYDVEVVYHLVAMITLRQEDPVAWRLNTVGVATVARDQVRRKDDLIGRFGGEALLLFGGSLGSGLLPLQFASQCLMADPDARELQQLHGDVAFHINSGVAREHQAGAGDGVFLARLVADINHGNFVAHGDDSYSETKKPGTGPGGQ